MQSSAAVRRIAARLLFIAALVASGCSILPHPPPQPEVLSLPPAVIGELAEVYSEVTRRFSPGQTGFLLLTNNHEALKWRLALVDHATKSIDVQYFIWQADAVGSLLFDRLLRAADRGVRVRILVDDLVFAAKDRDIAAISKHPNLDIKLFNPGRVRGSTVLGIGEFLLNFRQLNRRMHNKLFAVSNNQTIAHSHYKKYRRRILATGAELYEFRAQPAADVRDVSDVAPVRAKFISLHIKALVGDRKRCFIGSLNLDPRACEINTENGLNIQSDTLCGKLPHQFDTLMDPDNSWHVFVDENNYLIWKSSSGTVLSRPA